MKMFLGSRLDGGRFFCGRIGPLRRAQTCVTRSICRQNHLYETGSGRNYSAATTGIGDVSGSGTPIRTSICGE